MRLDELAKQIQAELVGDGSIEITSVATLSQAQPGQISFVSNSRYINDLDSTKASAVIVGNDVQSKLPAVLKSADPYYAFQRAVVALHGFRKHPHKGVHPASHVDPTATVGQGTIVYPGAYIGPRAKIGNDCIIYPNVTIYDDTAIGDRVIIHGGTTIGNDGFGFATSKGVHHKIPQVGNVVIEDDVEIGGNCTIARAAMGSTFIGKGTKIDSLVMIAHGVRIGAHGLIVAQVGISGSTTLGHHATLAGQVGLVGHLKLGDHVTVAAQSGVTSDIEDQEVVFGTPAMPISRARRVYTIIQQLPELLTRVKKIEQQVEELSDSGDTPLT